MSASDNIKLKEKKIIDIIPSKSDAHRGFICAALAGGKTEVVCNETSVDIEATRECLHALLDPENDRTGADLYCKESGSTLRFLLPVVGALGKRGIFHPVGRLSKRPLSPLYEELCAHGMKISAPGSVPLIAEGQLKGGDYVIPGNISSQFVTGLLLALPLLPEDSRIIVKGEFQSAGYADMTVRTIEKYGINLKVEGDHKGESPQKERIYTIPGGQTYQPIEKYEVEGDWSNSTFWFAAGLLGDSPITVRGLDLDSAQGDRVILDVIKSFGGKVSVDEDGITVYPGNRSLKGIEFDAGQTPDMIPAIALIATQAKTATNIVNGGRLRSKESDRLHSISVTLRSLGADVEELEEGLRINGRRRNYRLTGGTVSGYDDHRIVMMAAIASIICENKVSIIGGNAVNKSYPGFFNELERLGLGGNLEGEE